MPNLDSMRLSVRHCRHRTDNPGTRWGPRIIPDYELLLIREGEYVYSESDRTFPLRKGDLLLIEPVIEHVFLAKGPGYGVHCSAHFDLLDPEGSICFLGRLDSRSRRQPVSAPEHIAHVFELAAKSFAGKGRFRTETVNSAIRAIWLSLAENWFNEDGVRVSKRLEEMLIYLRRNLNCHLTRMDLSRQFHCSPEHINYLFKKELGESPSRFINHERVLKAFRLMNRDGLNVQEAALRSGFPNQYYFSRVFKSFFGYPPSRVKLYRKNEIDRIYDKHHDQVRPSTDS
ncbi:MAG TPA: AraC family transcriptional regulator [Tichowtungia sp.]|nr:AraC family transcriptional regulator [Tichowtungia sp.]